MIRLLYLFRNFIVISIITLQYLTLPAFAQTSEMPAPADLIIPQQQKLLNQEQVNKEIEEFKKWEEKADKENVKPNETEVKPDKNCFQIDEIKLEGNTILSQRTIGKIINNYQNTCISNKEIA